MLQNGRNVHEKLRAQTEGLVWMCLSLDASYRWMKTARPKPQPETLVHLKLQTQHLEFACLRTSVLRGQVQASEALDELRPPRPSHGLVSGFSGPIESCGFVWAGMGRESWVQAGGSRLCAFGFGFLSGFRPVRSWFGCDLNPMCCP